MDRIVLNGITWNHSRGITPLLAAAQRFSELNPGIEIEWKKRSLQEFADYPIEELTKHYDLLIIDHPWVGCAAATRCVLPLDEFLPNLPESQAGAGSGIYKMASSLGAAFGVAISAGIFVGLSSIDTPGSMLDNVITFSGRQDDVAIREAAMVALLFNLLMVVVAIIVIMRTVPRTEVETRAV